MRRPGRLGFALAALAGIALFASLGQWQWQRGKDKARMLADTAEMLQARDAQPLATALAAAGRDYTWVEGRGRFDDRAPLLLDNQMRDGRAGVRAYRLFAADGASRPLLVELGWLPLPADRALPAIEAIPGDVAVQGLLLPPPSAGLALGDAVVRSGEAWLMTRIDMDAIAAAADLPTPPAPRVLRLDPDLPLGYTRDLDILPNTLPPEKHRGYAVQWWALAATVFVVWGVLGWRTPSPKP